MAPRVEKATRRDFPDGIPSYGTDALRFTFCSLASTGRDIRFDMKRIEGYRNFCNKLWNATKYVLMNTEGADLAGSATPTLADRWIASRARKMLVDTERAIDTYRFDLYANAIYDFAWHEYCDWYLELTKPVLWDKEGDPAAQRATRRSLLTILETLLRASHPIIPFITETLWRRIASLAGAHGRTIMLQTFPSASELVDDPEAEAAIEWLKGVVLAVRNVRGEMNVKPSRQVTVLLKRGTAADRSRHAECDALLRRMAGILEIRWLRDEEPTPPSAIQMVRELEVHVPLEGLIDLDAERVRLDKEIERKTKEVERLNAKLTNESFVAKAPADVVTKERAKLADASFQVDALRAQRARLDRP
jgi:valyl-tRNA synthetase